MLTETFQKKYFDHAFFFVNFVIVYMKMIICHIPWLSCSRTQANRKGEVSIFFTFFLVMSVVQNVTWKKSTIVPMEWRQSLFIETGWPVYFRPNHANLVQVLCQEPRTSKCESHCFSYSTCTRLFQKQCSLIVLLKSDANNFKVWISLFFPSYKLLILYPTVSYPL